MTEATPRMASKAYFEDILPLTGWGVYYKFIIAMACVTSFTQSTAFFALSFSIALSSCDHPITKNVVLDLHACFMIGRAFGGLILSSLCDVYGRKRLLTYSMLLIFLSSFMAAFAYNYYVIITSAIILGSGLEANFCVVRVHLAEILPSDRRGLFLSLCDMCWAFGFIFISLLGILLKHPSMTETGSMDMRLAYWRMMFAIAGGLNITMACATALLEESPRYFLHIRKNFLAVLTLKQFYAINKSSYGESLQVKESDLNNMIDQTSPTIYPEPHGCLNVSQKTIRLFFKNFGRLFSKKSLKTIIILFIVKLSVLLLGYLEVSITLAKYTYYNRTTPRDGVQVIQLENLKNMSLCNTKHGSNTLYYFYFTLAACIVLGTLIVAGFVDFFGRKILSCGGLALCGICYIALHYISDITTKMIISTILTMSFSAALTTVFIINTESFPTALRCTSWGVTNFPALLISHFVIRYYHYMADYFFIIVGCLCLVGATAACFLQDLKRKPMIE